MEKIDGMSRDLELEAREKLKSVFPDCFAEGKLDIDKLLNICGEYIDDDFEKYEFKWKGKNDCLKLAQRRSAGTLRPCREESVDWENTENLYIEGDNLEVLKILQSSYYRKVKMIYIDPPYNTGNDFVYEDDYKDPIEKYKEVTSQTTKSNPETMGRFHTNWLNMMYPRLRLAANLLRDDGVIFISIDDNEVTNLRKICDEVFGEEMFIAQFTWKRRSGANDAKNNVSLDHEYVLCFGKSNTSLNGVVKGFENYKNPDNDPRGEWTRDNLTCGKTASQRPNLYYPITDPKTGITYQCNPDHVWRFEKTKMDKLILDNKVIFPESGNGLPAYKRHKSEVRSERKPYSSIIDTRLNSVATKEVREILSGQVFDYPKTVDIIKQLLNQATISSNNDLVLDFFSGSATTAHAVMQLNAEDGGNRRYICVQLPELCGEKSEAYKAGYKNICEIGKERIRRAGNKILAEWKEKQSQMEIGENESTVPPDVGFKVFKLDTSNISAWDGYAVRNEGKERLQKRIDEFLEGVKAGRTRLDVVYEIILKTGFPLTAKVETIDINGREVYSIDNETILICLFENVGFEDVEEMAQYAPAHIVFGEKCFADTSAVKNAKEALRDTGIDIKFF